MKNLTKNIWLMLWLGIFFPVFAAGTPTPKAMAAGALNLSELSNGILQALQSNNFEQLAGFLPTDTELVWLKRRGSEDLKALLENSSAVDIQTKLKTEYQSLVQTGVDKTINWSEMTLAESVAGKSSPKNKILKPVTLVLNSKNNQSVQILYEAIKINNRYFLFQRMQLKS